MILYGTCSCERAVLVGSSKLESSTSIGLAKQNNQLNTAVVDIYICVARMEPRESMHEVLTRLS